jgi:transcriptional regulator with XRE-family HTH domain
MDHTMSRGNRTFLIDTDELSKSLMARRHLTRQEFAKRIYTLRLAKGWSQSELARQAGLNRDAVSNYARGNNMPDPANLKKLAKALGVEASDLLPNYDEQALDMEANPALEIKTSQEDPSRSWVRLNREVSTGTVVKIMQALEEDGAAAARKSK